MDALPWADVDATLAHDAFTLIDVNELLGLNGTSEVVSINFYKLILG